MDTLIIIIGSAILVLFMIFRKRRKEKAKVDPLDKINPHLAKIENFRLGFGLVFVIIMLIIAIVSTCNK